MKAKYSVFCPSSGDWRGNFEYPKDAEDAAIEMLREGYLDVYVCEIRSVVQWVDRKAGTYQVMPVDKANA